MDVRWSERVEAGSGIPAWDRDETDLVLDLAREVAHGTERRYAPLTAFASGWPSAGSRRRGPLGAARDDALRRLVGRRGRRRRAATPDRSAAGLAPPLLG